MLWGTDSIWYGSPQDQIQAFRSFEIADELVEAHGYPQLTPELKAKIFGLNGARVYGVEVPEQKKKTEVDPIGRKKAAYREQAAPTFETFGPQDRSRVRGAARRARRPAGLSARIGRRLGRAARRPAGWAGWTASPGGCVSARRWRRLTVPSRPPAWRSPCSRRWLAVAGPGYRFGLWSLGTGFALIRYAVYGGIAAAAISAVGLVLAPARAAGGAACSARSPGSRSG